VQIYLFIDKVAQLFKEEEYLLQSFSQYIDAEEKNLERLKR